MITIAAFRADYPEFTDSTRYPDSQISYWLQIAYLMLNVDRFGEPAPYIIDKQAVAVAGAGYAVFDTITLKGGVTCVPGVLTAKTVSGSGGVLTADTTNVGAYWVPPTNPVQQQNTSGVGAGATFNLGFVSAPYTAYDFASELYVAHNISIERRAQDEANTGGVPGTTTGPISAKSVDKVSISYDVAAAIIDGAGDWNLTIYGTRFARLVRMFGMGPLTIVGSGARFWCGWAINPGQGVQPVNGPAWCGPIYALGIDWDC